MKPVDRRQPPPEFVERLNGRGLRLTMQRRRVYEVLVQTRDHPTADEVFLRARRGMPEISLATVYNCLDALLECGLVREIRSGPSARRFCANMAAHAHFLCERCGRLFDVPMSESTGRVDWMKMPPGFRVGGMEVSLRGLCAGCAGNARRGEERKKR